MLYTELEKNIVIFSSLFRNDFKELYAQIGMIARSCSTTVSTASHTRDYWVRDFMPIQIDENLFVQYIYNPDYLINQQSYITDIDDVISKCSYANADHMIKLPLVIDGGNMVFCKGHQHITKDNYLVMTEKAIIENRRYSREQIEQQLREAFHEPQLHIVWLPWDRKDMFGHTDGIVRYVGVTQTGKPRVLVNLEPYDDDIANQMYDALIQHFEVIELQLSTYDELSWAYINSLQTQHFTIIPGIGNTVTDAEALEQYRHLFPQHSGNIYQIQMRDFIAQYGGALNCLTWTLYHHSRRKRQ